MTPPPPPELRVLLFDVFGTCVAQRKPIADALSEAAQEALKSEDSSIVSEVRSKAVNMTYEQWFDLGGEWNQAESKFVEENIAKTGTVDWKAVDQNRINILPKLLADRGLIIPLQDQSTIPASPPSSSSSPSPIPPLEPAPGSLFTTPKLKSLAQTWHHLPPHPDTIPGLHKLNSQGYTTAGLSNTYTTLLQNLTTHSSIPFTHIFTSEMFNSYKPNPSVYLGAAEKLGVEPRECGLVAAHLGDLIGAKKCGFFTVYVERMWEEKEPELKGEFVPDLVVALELDGEGGDGGGGGSRRKGLVALAELLGRRPGGKGEE